MTDSEWGSDMENRISSLLGRYEAGQLSRRDLVLGLAALSAVPRAAAQSPASFRGLEMNHIALNVSDVGRSRDFYRELLDLPVLTDSPEACFLGLGEGNFLSLFRGDSGFNHYCIGIADFEVDRVAEELSRRGLNPRRPAGTNRVYFDDPDGLEVQLSAVGQMNA